MRSALLLTTVVLLLAAILTGCFSETPQVGYRNLEAAIRDGAVSRGWIPMWLPLSSYDIREKHDLDTNAQILLFKVQSWDNDVLSDHCQPVDAAQPPTLDASWWPEHIPDSAVYLYDCDEGFLAIDDVQAYFWRP